MSDPAAAEVRTTCPYCGVGCGVLAKVAADGDGHPSAATPTIRPISASSARRARRSARRMGLEGRVLHPEIGGKRADWDEALDLVAPTFSADDRRARPGFGRLLHLRPVADRGLLRRQQADEGFHRLGQHRHQFAALHGLVGRRPSPRLRRGHRARHLRGFRAGRPRRADRLEHSPGATRSSTSACSPRARTRGTKIVVIDPRRTATADECDLHLALDPGTRRRCCSTGCWRILAGTAPSIDAYVAQQHHRLRRRPGACGRRCADHRARCARLRPRSRRMCASSTNCSPRPTRTVTVYSQGVNQSAHGTDKVNAIINCHLATGRIGKPGTGPFSVTGQPNAMGGREVGGLANQLAAHMDFENPADVRSRRALLECAGHRPKAAA